VAQDWLDFQFEDELGLEDEKLEAFYCPYTNRDQCALITKGWQPQEICRDLDCEQLKWFNRGKRRQDAA